MNKLTLAKFCTALMAGLVSVGAIPTIASASEDNLVGQPLSNDYFISQANILYSGATQGNEGALASVDRNTVLVIRRMGEIDLYESSSNLVSRLSTSVPYTEFEQRSFGERGLTGVKGALFDKITQSLLVSTVQVANDCARPEIYLLTWNKVDKTLGAPKKVVSAPTCVSVGALPENFPAITANNRQGQPNTSQASGRIVKISSNQYLWAVGNFGDSWRSISAQKAAEKNSKDFFGKTLLISQGWKTSVFTTGHRNIQGLIRLASGQVLATEHGPQGGDELNRLFGGKTYGWPSVSLGHDYSNPDGTFNSGLAAPLTSGLSYAKSVAALYAWIPSVAPSQVLEVGETSPHKLWRKSLLVSTLKDQSLRRLFMIGDQVILDEKIPLGFRIRDLVWIGDNILCLDDASNLVSLKMTARGSTR